MKANENEEIEYVYVKKPLQVVLPHLGDMQAKKNPFSKTLKSMTIIRPTSTTANLKYNPDPDTKYAQFRSLRTSPCTRPCPQAEMRRVPHPVTPITESCEENKVQWTSFSEDSSEKVSKDAEEVLSNDDNEDMEEESEKKVEEKVFKQASVDQPPLYKVSLTYEITGQFKKMMELNEIDEEEAVNAKIELPVCYRKRLSEKTLILDLDDTLIHTIDPLFNYSFLGIEHKNYHTTVYEDLQVKAFFSLNVVIRPNAIEFLNEMSRYYEIVIYTASQKSYADVILKLLDPENKRIDYRIYRNSCTRKSGHYLKDLAVIKNRNIKRDAIIVDNSLIAICKNLDNGIHVPTYYGQVNDSSLRSLMPLLKELAKSRDLKKDIKDKVGLTKLFDTYKCEQINAHGFNPKEVLFAQVKRVLKKEILQWKL